MIVVSSCDGNPQQIRMQIHRANDRGKTDHELHIGMRIVAWIKKIDPSVGGHRPIVVLSRAVDSSKWLFMEQAFKSVLSGNGPQYMHRCHLMINCDIGIFEGRRKFVLTRRDFIVPRFDRDSKFKQTLFAFGHISQDSFRDCTKVVILQLLTLRRLSADQRSTANNEIKSLQKEFAVNKKIFLFATKCCDCIRRFCIAKQSHDAQCMFRNCID